MYRCQSAKKKKKKKRRDDRTSFGIRQPGPDFGGWPRSRVMTQQNAASISSVFTPALLGAIAYFVVFEYLRTRWTTFYAPKFKGGGIPHPGLFRWIPGVLRLSESDVIEACGTDAAIYPRFQRMCGFIMAALGVLACIILMPIYSKVPTRWRASTRSRSGTLDSSATSCGLPHHGMGQRDMLLLYHDKLHVCTTCAGCTWALAKGTVPS